MGVPTAKSQAVTVTAGQDNVVRLSVPSRGFLRRLIIEQTSGAAAGFTFTLYDALEGAGNESEGIDDVPVASRIFPPTTVAGSVYEDHTLNVPYANRDPNTVGVPGRGIYLRLHPQGSGSKNFTIAYTVDSPTFL